MIKKPIDGYEYICFKMPNNSYNTTLEQRLYRVHRLHDNCKFGIGDKFVNNSVTYTIRSFYTDPKYPGTLMVHSNSGSKDLNLDALEINNIINII